MMPGLPCCSILIFGAFFTFSQTFAATISNSSVAPQNVTSTNNEDAEGEYFKWLTLGVILGFVGIDIVIGIIYVTYKACRREEEGTSDAPASATQNGASPTDDHTAVVPASDV